MNNLTARRLEQLNTEHRWLFDVSRPTLHRLGFDIVNGTLGIIPIDIEDHMKYLGLRYEPYMVHFGFYSSKAILSRIVLMTPPKPLII
ncbi:hypothetical protein KA012_01895 [Candidatus Woesebacteria bacterium]|nr:hypothetical protein [Candidatus Woesebacteria bacterium]